MAWTAFSWGYWGWGNATRQLIAGVDAVEAGRGFSPPMFVDVRFNRSVRAVGFNGTAFERLVGPQRYVWMKSLGNRLIGEQSGPRMEIADPGAASVLLEYVESASRNGSRVIFFCSCEHFVSGDGVECHRNEVSSLLRSAASARGVELTTCEWPGGTPRSLEVSTTRTLIASIRRGRAFLPLSAPHALAEIAGLPWGSLVSARAGAETMSFVSGPARFQSGTWCLPVLHRLDSDASSVEPEIWATRYRSERRLEPVPAAASREAPTLAKACIYTIAHIDKLKAIALGSGAGSLKEKRSWATGARLLAEAKAMGVDLPVLFADAADCSRLLYCGLLTRIELSGDGTTYSFRELTALSGRRTPQDLVLLKSREHIAPGFIRPYALCITPSFLRSRN